MSGLFGHPQARLVRFLPDTAQPLFTNIADQFGVIIREQGLDGLSIAAVTDGEELSWSLEVGLGVASAGTEVAAALPKLRGGGRNR